MLLAALLWVGCAEAPARTLSAVDSAGVGVVTNLAGSMEAAGTWSLSSEPLVEIGGGSAPDVALFRVSAVTPLGGSRVAVGMTAPLWVLVFGPSGELEATLGRQGDGPGEFSHVTSVVALPADSVAVWDGLRRRISVFTADGRFAREADVSAFAPVYLLSAPNPMALAGFTEMLPGPSGGFYLFAEAVFGGGDEPGARRMEMTSSRVSAAGEERATLGPFPGMETYFGQMAGLLPRPLGARTYAATSGGRLVVGTDGKPGVPGLGPRGRAGRDRALAGS